MRTFPTITNLPLTLALTLATASGLIATTAQAQPRAQQQPSRLAYSRAVTTICAHALLFEGRHEIGTRAGAIAVANDIRASTRRRLALVTALPTPSDQQNTVARWLLLEQRLADKYATTYVRIYDVIDKTQTPRQRAQEPALLEQLVHSPDTLRRTAARLDQQLQVPDCTGGN